MRIVHILNELVVTGNGIVNATVDLACMQARAGHDVAVISSGGGYIDLLTHYGIRHFKIFLKPTPSLQWLRDLPRLRETVRKLRPDLVHAHMMTGAVIMYFGRALGKFGSYRLVTTVHNEWRMASHLMRLGDLVIVLSENGRKAFVDRGFPNAKIAVVPHGVLASSRRGNVIPLKAKSGSDQDVHIVTMGGLYLRKGIGDVIDAFSAVADEFPNARLTIAGWGPERELFEKRKKSARGSNRITFVGFVADTRKLLMSADIFVLASHTESFSLALAEAREAGCATIGTNVGGVPELLEQGRAGLIVPPNNVFELSRVLRGLLENPHECKKWQAASQSNIDRLTCARMEQQTMAAYRTLFDEAVKPPSSSSSALPDAASSAHDLNVDCRKPFQNVR